MEDYTVIPIQFEWKIPVEELTNLETGYGEKIVSDKKHLYQCPGIKYGLKVSIETKRGDNYDYKEMVYLTLDLFGLELQEVEIDGKFGFFIKSANFASKYRSSLDAKDAKHNYVYDEDDDDQYENWSHEICSKDDLLNPEKKFIVGKHLIVEMKGMLMVKSSTGPKYVQERSPTLGKRLWKREDKDFVIVGKEEDEEKPEIEVHKCVLASRSTVFDKMFKTDTKEIAENKLEIVDFDFIIVERAVEYCYDQNITYCFDDVTRAIPLLQFANKYDIADSDDIEVHLVERTLSPENVCEIINAAILSNSPKLRDFCFRALLIFMQQGIQVEKKDFLNEEFSQELLDKLLSGVDLVDENKEESINDT